jgi:alpha-L-fucosidase
MGARGPGARRLEDLQDARARPQREQPWEGKGLTRLQKVIAFCEWLPVTKGKLQGKQMKLLPEQLEFIGKIYGEGPTRVAGGSFSDAKDKPFTADDIRFTTKGSTLYAISLDIPSKDLLIASLSTSSIKEKIRSVELVGSNEKLNWSQTKNGLLIKPAKSYPSAAAVVYKLSME